MLRRWPTSASRPGVLSLLSMVASGCRPAAPKPPLWWGAKTTAFSALERGDMAAKGRAITRAVGIVDEGLRAALDLNAGGTVAVTLNDLYHCVLLRLTEAHARNDSARLRECSGLLTPLRDAWQDIKPKRLAA